MREPFCCPVCGEEVPRNAKSCPECGACEKSGWSADANDDGLDLPDEDFDYEKFAAEEFGSRTRMTGSQRLWWVIAIVLLVAFIWLLCFICRRSTGLHPVQTAAVPNAGSAPVSAPGTVAVRTD